MSDDNKGSSTDLKALAEIIDLRIPAIEGRFEILGTPEGSGMVPGPTDYMTLVAELKSLDTGASSSNASFPNIWLVPNASRPWLSDRFQQFLKQYSNKKFPPGIAGCSVISTTLVKSGRQAYGFKCINENKVLIYVPLTETE
jgi:hypothetical protein